MTTTTTEKKPFIAKKPASPFGGDPYNKRGGKGGGKVVSAAVGGANMKIKSISVPKFKGGSGGDR